MIKTKEVTWTQKVGFSGEVYYIGCVRDFTFVYLTYNEDNKYGIFMCSPTFRVRGNNGYKEYGYMSLEDAKLKAEELIRDEILSFLEI